MITENTVTDVFRTAGMVVRIFHDIVDFRFRELSQYERLLE